MSERSIAATTVGEWLEVLGSDSATPGGGAFAGLAGAAGAALISMVARLTVGKEAFADRDASMRGLIEKADNARAAFLDLADRDAHAFDSVMDAFRMPKVTDEEKTARSAAIQDGYASAAEVPLEVARSAVGLMVAAEEATASGNPQAASDGVSAGAALYCAALCAIANVEINAAPLKDAVKKQGLLDEVAGLRARADEFLRDAQTAFALRVGG
jgi:formiminotetrahydrofolate cyclodeaminase